MSLPISKLFLIIALIALPNLYYRAQYNVPLLLFSFAIWPSSSYRGTLVLLLIFSWLIDVYCIVRSIAASQEEGSKPRIVLILQCVVFVAKVFVVIAMVVSDRETREAINPQNFCANINKFLHGSPEKSEPVLQN